ncbi:related to enoyl-CoA hydratase/isomerase family protein [Ramularia collo-cygni]|uniref:Related to enoyl-CoA hydratase/isomerase family protein n=1 Tax=Ramularia collo-cygni TaxID=112498 RepID=A0A2D3VAC1_9PEZI|nr:related to enoyl-CoA hydratase/isomerase family protein [Ramularia collo-cygni]CZT22400.1 related to enoyl-CoA hydratase/isomerase family protein [Ramularia collo-cygni]
MASKYIQPAEVQELPIPKQYSDLGFTQIRVTNVPESSKEVTPVQLLTLYRPNKVNAFTPTMMAELETAYTLFDIDDRVKCIVQTGSGKMFCAGADLETGFVGGEESNRDHRDGGGRVTMAINRCRKPTIAALNGSAVGVGITMTLPMNIRIAYQDAKIGFVFARRGLVMEAASSFFLPRLIGYSKALHLCTTGATYPAKHSLYSDLFTELLPTPDAVLPRALELADEIVKNCSGISIHLCKEMMYRNPNTPEGAHLLDSKLVYEMFSSKDNKEGVQAFLQKRQVNFQGTMQNDAPQAWPWWHSESTANRPVGQGYKFKAKM